MSLTNSIFGVSIKTPKGEDKDLVEEEHTQKQNNETKELHKQEVFNWWTVNWDEKEEKPNKNISADVHSRPLSCRTIFCDRYSTYVNEIS